MECYITIEYDNSEADEVYVAQSPLRYSSFVCLLTLIRAILKFSTDSMPVFKSIEEIDKNLKNNRHLT